jgi:hypothetical protein
MTRVVVDADYLVYAAGYAVEKTKYDVQVVRPDGTEAQVILDSAEDAKVWLSDEPEGTVHQIDKLVEAEPLDHALFLVNRTLGAVDTHLTEAGVEFEKMELFITGKGNFRDQIATIKGYKANRDPAAKPVHYKSIRRFLKNRWGAEEVHGYEADDAVAMIACENEYDPSRVVIVTVDKDLLTVPGAQYNFRTKKLVEVSKQEALVNFYRQLVVGDPVDNIGGAFKAGKKAAEAIKPEMSEWEMYVEALDLYAKGKGRKGCPYAHLSAQEALLENARLVHLLRAKNDVWQPPIPEASSKRGSGEG